MKIRKLFLFVLTLLLLNTYVVAETSNIHTTDKLSFVVTADQPEFVLKLKSNPTTGYSWFLSDYNANLIEVIKHSYEPPEKKLVGASGSELWTFRVKPVGFVVPHQTLIRLVYSRPWENPTGPEETTFRITTVAAP